MNEGAVLSATVDRSSPGLRDCEMTKSVLVRGKTHGQARVTILKRCIYRAIELAMRGY